VTKPAPDATEANELPARARKDMAARALIDAIERFVRECFRERDARDEWVDQERSPLGRRRHLALVRRGELPAVKDGKRVLVKRCDLDTYLREHRVEIRAGDLHRDRHEDDGASAVAAGLLGELGLSLCGAG
jgi:excisionase family DNA binding protein